MLIYLLMHAFGVIVFFIWFLYVAIDGRKFGPQSSCNHFIKFVLFFVNVRATVTWFRVLMIVFFSGAVPFILLVLGFLILASDKTKEKCAKELQKLFNKHPRLWLVRYVLGTP
jgi:hypothetical protein